MSKYDSKYPEELLTLMSQGLLDCEVYAKWKISKTTFYEWINKYPKLKEAHEKGLAQGEAITSARLKEMALKGDDKGYKSMALLLATKYGTRYEPCKETPATVTNNTQINVAVTNQQQIPIPELVQKLQDNLQFLKDKNIPLIEYDGTIRKDNN